MNSLNKRGISPVVATTLLISIALILALIIFLWARSFITDIPEKFGEPVERACQDVNFDSEVYTDKIYILNSGNVAIYGLEVFKITGSSQKKVAEVTFNTAIAPGKDNKEGDSLNILEEGVSLEEGDSVLVLPVILGEAKSGEYTIPYTCDKQYGVSTTIVSD